MAAMVPWLGSFKHKEPMLHLCPILVLVRDKDSRGTVSHNPGGSCRLDYARPPINARKHSPCRRRRAGGVHAPERRRAVCVTTGGGARY
ncbi:hypothetical protein BC936DRAFT_136703 [Jimgerdemannia flammicorona]|uniref:Uncharacterized protein n=1 Tax=Jimgerdemannia flammicorona TaxID=994334 RepID=A0A433CYZ6_9FUNG|nr:hypothetical protein BC936DRAFT_136703 [Jimgerdemannia flammicorona]